MKNRIVIDELKRRISSVQMYPMKHCTELKLKAWLLSFSSGNRETSKNKGIEILIPSVLCTYFLDDRNEQTLVRDCGQCFAIVSIFIFTFRGYGRLSP